MRKCFGETRCRSALRLPALGPSLSLWALYLSRELCVPAPNYRSVALKFLASHLVEDQKARDRFTREAKAGAALDHPNICTIQKIDEAAGRYISRGLPHSEQARSRALDEPPNKDLSTSAARSTAPLGGAPQSGQRSSPAAGPNVTEWGLLSKSSSLVGRSISVLVPERSSRSTASAASCSLT